MPHVSRANKKEPNYLVCQPLTQNPFLGSNGRVIFFNSTGSFNRNLRTGPEPVVLA